MTPHDIKNFIQGYAKYADVANLPLHQKEQVMLRMYMCKPCLDAGKCSKCGCSTPAMFYAPAKVDAARKFPEFFSQTQWEILKANINEYAEFISQLNAEPPTLRSVELVSNDPT